MFDHPTTETTFVSEIAQAVVDLARARGENPLELGLSLHLGDDHWWVSTEMDHPYDWPSGTGTLTVVRSVDAPAITNVHLAVNAIFREYLAFYDDSPRDDA